MKEIFENNKKWSQEIKKKNPEFFNDLSKQQTPEYLWIGCSDSRVPANEIMNLAPGEVFVHRNIANVVVHSDLNCLSVLQYAVEVLKVKHIIVCGHYDCGGVLSAMGDEELGLIDNWLRHIKDVMRFNSEKFEGLSKGEAANLLCELNVKEQVKNICDTTIVKNAWKRGADLSVHGLIFSLRNGILKDLGVSVSQRK